MTRWRLWVIVRMLAMQMMRWRVFRVGRLAVTTAVLVGMRVSWAQEYEAPGPDELKPMLRIEWRLGQDYPMGIQDSAVGCVGGRIVSAGGFTRHPLDICKQYPEAFAGQPSGFTRLAFVFDPKNEPAGWKRVADMPGPARQGAAVAVVDNLQYAMGGFNYTQPFTYRDTYRLQEREGLWVWEELLSSISSPGRYTATEAVRPWSERTFTCSAQPISSKGLAPTGTISIQKRAAMATRLAGRFSS